MAPDAGKNVRVPVYVKTQPGCSRTAEITLTAVSEGNDKVSSSAARKIKL